MNHLATPALGESFAVEIQASLVSVTKRQVSELGAEIFTGKSAKSLRPESASGGGMEAFFGSDRQSQFWRALLTRDQQNTSIRAPEVSANRIMLLSLPVNAKHSRQKNQALQMLLAVQVNAGWRELPGAGDRLWRKRRAAPSP